MRRLMIAAVMFSGLSAAPALAVTTTTTVTLTGTISVGRDEMGTFTLWGTNLAGKSFSASYIFVSDLESSAGQLPGVDLVDIINAATSASFSMTINNHTFTAADNTTGMIRSVDGLGGLASGGKDELQLAAVNTTGTRVFDMSATIGSEFHDMLTDTKSINAVPSFTYFTQPNDTVTADFSYTEGVESLTHGRLAINKIVVSSTPELLNAAPPVPEPGEWAMIAAGLGLVGFTANRRRAA